MVKNNLYTFGGEYRLPNGTEYVGSYHIHPEKGAMVGAMHSNQLHDSLSPYFKRIYSFIIDYSDLPATSEKRRFYLTGDKGSEFRIEVKDATTNQYYNFVTKTFQTAQSSLQDKIDGYYYNGSITFPAVTGGDDQYNVFVYAVPGTEHADYKEVRFRDRSIDLNKSTGSNSLMLQKVIYQYADINLTLSTYSSNTASITGTLGTQAVAVSRGKTKAITSFSTAFTVASNKAVRISRQPTEDDFLALQDVVIGSSPTQNRGEDIYPSVSDTDAIDGDFTGGGFKYVIDSNVADKIKLGDRVTVTSADLSNTVDGATTNSNRIVFDNNVNTSCAVGDRLIRSNNAGMQSVFDEQIILVTHINPDTDNVKEIQVDSNLSCVDGANISFQPKVNYTTVTVDGLNPDTDNVKEFNIDTTGCGFVDNVTLGFSNQKNYSWPANNIENITAGMSAIGTNVTSNSTVSNYEDVVIEFLGTEEEKILVKYKEPGIKPIGDATLTNGIVTAQEGDITFSRQQLLALAGDTIQVGGYGIVKIKDLHGYDVTLSDLKVTLTPVTATVVNAVNTNTSVTVSSRIGILDGDTVTGIGIDPTVANPTVSSGATSQTTQGAIVLSAAQTLEKDATLTFGNSSQVATVTGNITVNRVGTANKTIYIDVAKFLTMA